jgi:phospholipid/cholesterol/gamma-HCH transport system permease protein
VSLSGAGAVRRPIAAVGGGVRRGVEAVGRAGTYLADSARGLADVGTWWPLVVTQARLLGVDSLPIALFIALFTGIVLALLASYSFTRAVPLYFVGTLVEKTLTMELAPVLTGLALAGRVGANIAAELGTMAVTEQIDALETLAYDPVAYLAVPRFLASLVMMPALVMLANAMAIICAWITLRLATDVTTQDYIAGLRLSFVPFQIFYSLIKALFFGGAIALVCSYEGYITEAGAEGVGRSTAKAVVIASVSILVLDALIAALLAPYIQPGT